MRELARWPAGFVDEILEARVYIQAKQMVESATTKEARKALPDSDLIALAQEIEFDLVREARDAQKKKQDTTP